VEKVVGGVVVVALVVQVVAVLVLIVLVQVLVVGGQVGQVVVKMRLRPSQVLAVVRTVPPGSLGPLDSLLSTLTQF